VRENDDNQNDDEAIDLARLIQSVKDKSSSIEIDAHLSDDFASRDDNHANREDSLNHANQMMKNLLNKTRHQINLLADISADQSLELIQENNSLILNYSRRKVRHDYRQLHHREFVKSAKLVSSFHEIDTSNIYEEAMIDSQSNQ
jgi:hypothetical protein